MWLKGGEIGRVCRKVFLTYVTCYCLTGTAVDRKKGERGCMASAFRNSCSIELLLSDHRATQDPFARVQGKGSGLSARGATFRVIEDWMDERKDGAAMVRITPCASYTKGAIAFSFITPAHESAPKHTLFPVEQNLPT